MIIESNYRSLLCLCREVGRASLLKIRFKRQLRDGAPAQATRSEVRRFPLSSVQSVPFRFVYSGHLSSCARVFARYRVRCRAHVEASREPRVGVNEKQENTEVWRVSRVNPSIGFSFLFFLALLSTRTPATLLAVTRRREIATRDAPRVGRGRRPSPSDSDIFYSTVCQKARRCRRRSSNSNHRFINSSSNSRRSERVRWRIWRGSIRRIICTTCSHRTQGESRWITDMAATRSNGVGHFVLTRRPLEKSESCEPGSPFPQLRSRDVRYTISL